MAEIPFNRPFIIGRESEYLVQAVRQEQLAGNGLFTQRCHAWIERNHQAHRALLTHSCTAALEMAALLADIQPGDEIILPSYTFTSTANAFVLRGGVPVFADISPDTLNIDPADIRHRITPKTRAIIAVHYAGIACDMDALATIARDHRLLLIEDAAQAVHARHKDRFLGSIGDLGCYSFHETKNLICGEGGALLINQPQFAARAEILWEKGTNRAQFFRGEIAKYTWVDIGSSFLPSECVAAFLFAQMEHADAITARRREIWHRYYQQLEPLEQQGLLRRPVVPDYATHNGHLFYILLPDGPSRDRTLASLNQQGIQAVFHYLPLHASPMGRRFCRYDLPVTERSARCLLRLPCHYSLIDTEQQQVLDAVWKAVQA
jgi:dTDP-4-amino-4,6-dideoxygalactose transaminase